MFVRVLNTPLHFLHHLKLNEENDTKLHSFKVWRRVKREIIEEVNESNFISLVVILLPNKHLSIQSQQLETLKTGVNLFKVKNKATRTRH